MEGSYFILFFFFDLGLMRGEWGKFLGLVGVGCSVSSLLHR